MRIKLAILILLAGIFVGCYKESSLKTEKAEVIQMAYIPSTSGCGVGVAGKGNVTTTIVSTDEVWAVVLRCYEHNATFSIRGKNIYDQCRVGKIVTLEYVEYINNKGRIMGYKTKKVIP